MESFQRRRPITARETFSSPAVGNLLKSFLSCDAGLLFSLTFSLKKMWLLHLFLICQFHQVTLGLLYSSFLDFYPNLNPGGQIGTKAPPLSSLYTVIEKHGGSFDLKYQLRMSWPVFQGPPPSSHHTGHFPALPSAPADRCTHSPCLCSSFPVSFLPFSSLSSPPGIETTPRTKVNFCMKFSCKFLAYTVVPSFSGVGMRLALHLGKWTSGVCFPVLRKVSCFPAVS